MSRERCGGDSDSHRGGRVGGRGRSRRDRSLREAVGGLAAALSQAQTVAREIGGLGVEFTRIARVRSSVAPAKGDRRFNDPAWTSNPAFRRIEQGYLASAGALDRIVGELDDGQEQHPGGAGSVRVRTS